MGAIWKAMAALESAKTPATSVTLRATARMESDDF
jgi:hypothetical protein